MGGNTKGIRRRFGAVRKLPSGRWQARYLGPDDVMRPADRTFATKTEAERWLIRTEAEIIDANWVDPDAGRVPFGEYAADWIEERLGLRPKTVQLYRFLLAHYLVSAFGRVAVADIREAQVRRWRKNLLDAGVTAVTAAKAYRLLRAVMNTAADDGLIRRNPCRLRGAGQERSPERPVLSLRQVLTLADAIDARYRAPDPARGLRQPSVGRAGRASPLRHRRGGAHGARLSATGRVARRRIRLHAAQVGGRAADRCVS